MAVAVMALFLAGCEKEDDKKAFQGFSRIVKERHEARQKRGDSDSGQTSGGTDRPAATPEMDLRPAASQKKKAAPSAAAGAKAQKRKSTTVRKVVILSEDGGSLLGRGIVYLDENGKIIGIRVY